MTGRGRTLRLAVCLAALLLAASLGLPAHAADRLTPVKLQLLWVHQAQFAGFYLAADAGLFRQAGLEVEIIPGGPGISPLDRLAEGKCDFTVSWLAPAVEQRSKGMEIKHLAQLVQRSGMLLVARADSGISQVDDMAGRRVGLWDSYFALAANALFQREALLVRQVIQNVSMAPFLYRAVDVASAMRYNEYHQLMQAGLEPSDLVVFDLAELGFNFPEDGIYTTDQHWQKDPALCRSFVRACLDGWRLAFAQPEKALNAVMKRVDDSRLASNRPHQAWMLATMRQLINHGVAPDELGRLDQAAYQSLVTTLTAQGFLHSRPDLGGFSAPAWRSAP